MKTAHPIGAMIASVCVALLPLTEAAAAPAAPAERDSPAPTLGTASLSAVAYATLPRPAYVEVVLADDSPDNVRLAWEVHHGLERAGWLADKGPTLRLTMETYTIGAAGASEPAARAAKGGERGEELYVLGVLEAGVVDAATGQKLWEGRAVYRMNNGDLPLGAVALAPLFVEALGRNLSNEPVRLE